jgi:hypothetical protein
MIAAIVTTPCLKCKELKRERYGVEISVKIGVVGE